MPHVLPVRLRLAALNRTITGATGMSRIAARRLCMARGRAYVRTRSRDDQTQATTPKTAAGQRRRDRRGAGAVLHGTIADQSVAARIVRSADARDPGQRRPRRGTEAEHFGGDALPVLRRRQWRVHL